MPVEWLSLLKGSDKYNTACVLYDQVNEVCTDWDTAPIACKTYVCSVRSYSKKELTAIDKLLGAKYGIQRTTDDSTTL